MCEDFYNTDCPKCWYNGPFPWNMLITFTHAYRPCWLANAIELCTKQTRNRVCVTHPLAVYKTARCSLILPNKNDSAHVFMKWTISWKGSIHEPSLCDVRCYGLFVHWPIMRVARLQICEFWLLCCRWNSILLESWWKSLGGSKPMQLIDLSHQILVNT